MDSNDGRVLIVDDDRRMCEMLQVGLERQGFSVRWCTTPSQALDDLDQGEFDAVVTDLNLNGRSGLELCERIVANHRDVPVVVITAFGSLETAVGALRVGAYDFVTKPFEMTELVFALNRAIQHRRLGSEVRRLRQVVDDKQGFDEIIGTSDAMRRVYDLLERMVDSDSSVLITGESGTGKDVVARALHRRGPRSNGPFVAINCAAMPEALLESELFGHARGAFTDARTARTGLFVHANDGTLLLDEIGDLPLGLQPKLLRVLQERTVRPVGGDTEVPFDVRVIVATNRDLPAAVSERRFREDLYFRINVLHVEMPPLRARGTDVLLLAQEFLRRAAARTNRPVVSLSAPVAERLLAYNWPGNVRELQNCIERAVTLARYEHLTVDDLPEHIRSFTPKHFVVPGEAPDQLVPLEEVERRYILRVMEAVGGNKTVAARVLGLDRKTLYRKLAAAPAA